MELAPPTAGEFIVGWFWMFMIVVVICITISDYVNAKYGSKDEDE